MLKELTIKNLILISTTTIQFDEGFNVLSGETGAGKSAVMKAIYMLSGEKAEASLVRHGATKAIIEGIFDISGRIDIYHLLEKAGIDHDQEEPLIIRREIALTGKGKCSINNCTTQLSLLKGIGSLLLEMVGQHANRKLLSVEEHRGITDMFGDLTEDVIAFAKGWKKETALSQEIETLVNCESQRVKEIDRYRLELEELEEANLKNGEEEELFSEYSRLVNADEILNKIREITETLNGERISVLSLLKRHHQLFDQLVKLNPAIEKCALPHNNALVELQEVSYSLDKLAASVEHNPERLHIINERLTLISKIKKKYGSTFEAIKEYREGSIKKIQELESAENRIGEGKEQLKALEETNSKLACVLTSNRKAAATKLAQELTKQLSILNMPKAKLEIELTSQQRCSYGDDQVEFFLIPNIGEKRIPIKEHASGGELSRILLALQTLLAGKNAVSTLVFDEIDANIGGATAVVIGEKLREIGRSHQVLCITHFPQVAKQADTHIQIEKREENGRTFSHISRLDTANRQCELDRMAGFP